MNIQNQQDLFNYLSQEEHINPAKLQIIKQDEENEMDKENKVKVSKIKDDNGQIINILVDKDQNSQIYGNNSLLGSNISDTKSFYKANGVSKIENADISTCYSREQLLSDWQDLKKLNSNNNTNNNNSNINSNDCFSINSCKSPSKYQSDKKLYQRQQQLSSSLSKNINSTEKSDSYLTQAQIMQKYFNSRIGYGDGKISAPVKTTNTIPQSPKFATSQRSAMYALRSKNEEMEMQRSNSKNSQKKIDPKNFYLETDKRAKSRPQTPIKEDEEFHFKARPKPEYKEFVIQKPEKQQIEFKEFQLNTEGRGRSKEQQLKLKIENEKKQEELQRQFQASQIPDYSELSSKYINHRCGSPKPTLPIDFKFQTDQRADYGYKKSQISQSAEKYEFKARKMPDFSKARSPAKPSPKKATTPIGMKLSSTIRAEERKLFDEHMEIQVKKNLMEQRFMEENQKTKEEEEEEALRQQSQFKAQPIKKYKPVEIHKSEIPLTQPESPKFRIDQRLRSTDKSKDFM